MNEPRQQRTWAGVALPIPPPSRRGRRPGETSLEAQAVRLLRDVEDVLAVLGQRSPADFRPLPFLLADRTGELQQAFDQQDPVPPALVVQLAPLLSPRLERLAPRLRRRLGRERRLLPLSRIREMDPACVQRNSRRPGRNLIEKAGPRQVLHGVVRVPRFDTTENRVLVAASQRLERDAAELLQRLPRDRRRSAGGRAADLRVLLRACREILSRPELQGIGRPRPGERPSNAMLGDADYRAAWRAWQLLRREEARFADEWLALQSAWNELQVLAAWSLLDGRDDMEPLPAWARVRHARKEGARVEHTGPRRWIQWQDGGPRVIEAELASSGPVLRVVEGLDEAEWGLPSAFLLGPPDDEGESALEDGHATRDGALQSAQEAVATLPFSGEAPSDPDCPPARLVGLSFLDAASQRAYVDEDRLVVQRAGASAAARVPLPDEQPLIATGRQATWLAGAAGPHQLHRDEATLAGHLARSLGGTRDTALVVPNSISLLARMSIRRTHGPLWLVPAPVAAALACDSLIDEDGEEPRAVLVVVATDASLDLVVLERRRDEDNPAEWVWVRSAPRRPTMGGRQEQAKLDLASLGAWLRVGGQGQAWALEERTLRSVTYEATTLELEADARDVIDSWAGVPVDLAVAVGLGDVEFSALQQATELHLLRLHSGALAEGAARFLQRYRAGLPTWKDRLPTLQLLARKAGLREEVSLVKAGQLVAPGDPIAHEPPNTFRVDAGQDRVEFQLAVEGRPEPAFLRIDGHPLPLGHPVRVRVRVRYVHGRDGLSVSLVPVHGAGFQRMEFEVAGPGSPIEESAQARVPVHEEPSPPLEEHVEDLMAALEAARSMVSKVPKKQRKQAGKLGREFRTHLAEMKRRARFLRASGPLSMPPELRERLEDGPAAWLDWLLAKGRLKRAGRAPALTREETRDAVMARASLLVRGSGTVAGWLAEDERLLPPTLRFEALGRLVDGQHDLVWDALCQARPTEPAAAGAWALGIARALDAHPELAPQVHAGEARAILEFLVDRVEQIAAKGHQHAERYRRALFRLALLPPRLCRLRAHGLLGRDDRLVLDAVERLRDCRHELPEGARGFIGRGATYAGDEPIAVAISHLEGRTIAIPSMEDA